jgi:hypothetical protein
MSPFLRMPKPYIPDIKAKLQPAVRKVVPHKYRLLGRAVLLTAGALFRAVPYKDALDAWFKTFQAF